MLLIFGKMLTVAALLALGVLIYRLGIITSQGSRELSSLVVQVCCPIMIVHSALEDETVFTLSELSMALAVCVGIHLLLLLAGELLPRLLNLPRQERPYYSMLSLFGNVGFIGIPVGLSILGSGAMLYIVIFNVIYSVFFYSYGLLTMSRAVGHTIPFQPRSLVNPGMLSCLLALLLYLLRSFTRFSLPALIVEGLGYISSTTTFLAMVVLGVSLATTPLKTVLANLRMYAFVLLRYLLLPCCLAVFLELMLPDEPMMVAAMALMAAMPAGNMPVMLASNYHASTDTLTSGIITSTLLCILTIPVVSLFFPS